MTGNKTECWISWIWWLPEWLPASSSSSDIQYNEKENKTGFVFFFVSRIISNVNVNDDDLWSCIRFESRLFNDDDDEFFCCCFQFRMNGIYITNDGRQNLMIFFLLLLINYGVGVIIVAINNLAIFFSTTTNNERPASSSSLPLHQNKTGKLGQHDSKFH